MGVCALVHAVCVAAFQLGHLQARHVVQHLVHKGVAAFAGCIAAQHIRPPRLRMSVDQHFALVIVLPSDVPDGQAVVVIGKSTHGHRLNLLLQLLLHFFGVEKRLTDDAPHAQAVNRVVVIIGLPEALQRLPVFVRQKSVVLVGTFVDPYSPKLVLPVKKPLFDPVRYRNRVERHDDLLVIFRLAAQSDVQLVEIIL